MTRHIQSPGIVRTVCKHFQGYLGIFRDIDAYSSTLTGVQLRDGGVGWEEGGGGAGLPCPFFKIEKNALILEKKTLIVFIFGLNFPFKFQLCSFLLVFLTKCLLKYPSSTKSSLPHKLLVARLHSGTILLAKRDFMLCTTSDTFRILACSELYLVRYIQTYSRISSIIKAYSRILRHC